MHKIENTGTPLEALHSTWGVLVSAAKENTDFSKSGVTALAANVLKDIYAMDFECASFIAANLAAHAKNMYSTNTAQINPDVEAVQIEWISNGILVRGKGADGAFCNYYRDTSQFISQSVGSRAIQFVKSKEPKVGDTCILYFGMSDEASE